jgi:hypothetical protein
VLTIISCVIIFTLEVFLIFKVGLRKLDPSALVQLSIYLIAAVSRVVIYVLPSPENNGTFIQVIGVLTMLATWGLLYFMVFEMMYIRAALESETPQEYMRRKTKIKW